MRRMLTVLFSVMLLVGLTWAPAYSGNEDEATTAAPASAEQLPLNKALEAPDKKVIELASPASSTSEMDFIKITPCRVADTRLAGGSFGPYTSRNFQVKGSSGFAAQGGNASGCGIPDGAAAVELTFTAVNQTGTGWMRMQPWASVMLLDPRATLLNYSTALNASNSVIVPVCTGSGCSYDLYVRNYGAASGLLIDVTGYFAPELFAVVASNGAFVRGSGVTYTTKLATGIYAVGFDRNITRCAFTATRGTTGFVGTVPPGFINVAGRAGTTNAVWIDAENTGAAHADVSFHLKVDC